MTLQQLSKTVDFVQATTPSNANDGETWLDTSQSPPQLKVFDSSANAFVRPRSIQNLDAPVSNAGATQSDIQSGAEGALEGDISQLSPASNSVAGNLDGGVSGDISPAIDAYSAQNEDSSGSQISVEVTGEGYAQGVVFAFSRPGTNQANIDLLVDGNSLINHSGGEQPNNTSPIRLWKGWKTTNSAEYQGAPANPDTSGSSLFSSTNTAYFLDQPLKHDSKIRMEVQETSTSFVGLYMFGVFI